MWVDARQAMQLMVEGDKWEMYIPSELAPQQLRNLCYSAFVGLLATSFESWLEPDRAGSKIGSQLIPDRSGYGQEFGSGS